MKVDPEKNLQIIYSVQAGGKLGNVVEAFAVQLTDMQTLSLTYQRLTPQNAQEFARHLDERDHQLLALIAEYSEKEITRKFSKKELRPSEFFARYLTEKMLQEQVRPYVEDKLSQLFAIGFEERHLYMMSKSGNPAQQKLTVSPTPVSTHFHFKRSEAGTIYYPTFRHGEEKISFINKAPLMITTHPCLLLVEDVIYSFNKELDGKKLLPFFKKWNIEIPKESEPTYYKRFISQLIEKHTVISEGFRIHNIETRPELVLKMEVGWNNQPQLLTFFDYNRAIVPAAEPKNIHVKLEAGNDSYTYYKIHRQKKEERALLKLLEDAGLKCVGGSAYQPARVQKPDSAQTLISWLNDNEAKLRNWGVRLDDNLNQKYFLGKIDLNIEIEESNDWFDIHAVARFGEFTVPFLRLRKYILNRITEFPLPDGKIAIIPEAWFLHYRDLMALTEDNENGEIRLKRHHHALIDDFMRPPQADALPDKDFYSGYRRLADDEAAPAPPLRLQSVLRPYQTDGFRWLKYLQKNGFGGVLADDMGLGKTLQTLALLLSLREEAGTEEVLYTAESSTQPQIFSIDGKALNTRNVIKVKQRAPTLIAMPTSLIHNWEQEIKKWAPELRCMEYTGLDRREKLSRFRSADIILTTYGAVRNDIELLKKIEFQYVILDESQVIKNPDAKISQSVRKLKAKYRLTLSGTPIENSLTDLWSQLTFLNPGILGSFGYFKENFVGPIEKKNDEERKTRLKNIIQPFILRRTKDQVAADLPALTEKYYYSEMLPAQAEIYNKVRNSYREMILSNADAFGKPKARFLILKGLMQLRQIANHPAMMDDSYLGESGKFQDITNNLSNLIEENHRVLVFSQFVKHLDLIRKWLEENNIPFNYLTGQSRHRAEEIESFKNNADTPVFLISLKAGGVGLTLTEADYVFMCDPWWNPAVERQAINRAHRIGQDKPVFAYRFIARDTVEEKTLLLQERKLKLSEGLIHANMPFEQSLSMEDVEMLFS